VRPIPTSPTAPVALTYYRSHVSTLNAFFTLSGESVPMDATVTEYSAHEALSEPFSLDVEFWTADPSFEFEKLMRQPLLFEVVDEGSKSRYWHGIVGEAEFLDADEEDRFRYRVRLVPFLDALRHREGSKIFQEMTNVTVIKKVLEGAGIEADKVEWKLYNDYEGREYVVQYRESEWNFIHRLMEDEGMFYFFQHTPEGHKMIVADDAEAFAPGEAGSVTFAMASDVLTIPDAQPLKEFSRTRRARTTQVVMRDYDFEKPNKSPVGSQDAEDNTPARYYEYPGGFTKVSDGTRRAQARMRALRRDADTCAGRSAAIHLRVGEPFGVEGAAEEYCNGGYVITSLRTTGIQTPGADAMNYACRNEFVGIPEGAPFGPALRAHRPRIRGVQTAMVMGPTLDEETIHCDKYGRIKVHFYWDRVGPNDDKASCWMRVTQLNTGGSVITPRVGWEVAIAFFEGDPDRPFILGRLYNAERPPPYSLPGTKASGSLKSSSSPGGAGANEIKMADSGGSQGFGITAQKDLNITVGNNKTEKVGVDESVSVTQNMKRNVGSNEKLEVGADQDLTFGANLEEKITGAQSVTVGGNEISNATSNFVESVDGSRTYTVGGNYTCINNSSTVSITGAITRTVGAVQLMASPYAILENVGGAYSETVGAAKVQLVKGLVAESVGAMKTQTTAAASIHIISGKMQVTAPMISTMVGGLHYQQVGGDYTVKAPMITLLGATGTFKGGSGELKLGGGPILAKGSKIAIKGATIIKMGASLKMGSG
jgi:type VI secretion system secreted protein VgrG